MELHARSCYDIVADMPPVALTAKPQIQQSAARFECVYCSKSDFKSEAELNQHVSIVCRIAKSFHVAPAPTQERSRSRASNQEEITTASSSSSVQAFVQGRIRRKGDTSALHLATASLLQELNKKYDDSSSNNNSDEVKDVLPRGLKQSSSAISSSLKAAPVVARSKAKAAQQQLDSHAKRTSSARNFNPNNSDVHSTSKQPVGISENANEIALSITSTSVSHRGPQQQRPIARARKASAAVPRKLDKLQPK